MKNSFKKGERECEAILKRLALREKQRELQDKFISDEDEILDCPNCGREYDDADADFLICHHCGYDAEKK